MKRLSLLLYGLILSGIVIVPVMAADCPTLVKQALAATDTICHETGKNQACYGNISLRATPVSRTNNFTFNQPGDRVNISEIKSLQLSPMTLDTGEWGVALMNIEANLPAAKPADVTLLAFGDVTLENAVPSETAVEVSIVGTTPVNVRLVPNTQAGVVGTLKTNQTVTALERLVDSSWIRVKVPDSEQIGWVKADMISSDDDLRTLNIVDGKQPYYHPMQAFTFKSGSENQSCAEIPKDGLIIQTPEGAGEVQLWINQVVVKLGSTVYFQAQPSGDMKVTTVEGHATVESMGVSYTAVAGSSVTVKLDADMNAVSPPSLPQAYQMAEVANLPVEQLNREITIHPPLTEAEIASVQQAQASTPAGSIDNSTNAHGDNGGNSANTENCPKDDKHPGPKDDKCPKDGKPPKDDKPGPKDDKGPPGPKDDKPGPKDDKGPKDNKGPGPKDDKVPPPPPKDDKPSPKDDKGPPPPKGDKGPKGP